MLEDADDDNPAMPLTTSLLRRRLGMRRTFYVSARLKLTAGVPLQLEKSKLARLRREVQRGLSGPSEALDMDNVIAEAETRFRERTTP